MSATKSCNNAAPNYYEAPHQPQGVGMQPAGLSLSGRRRGAVVSSGNTRLNQLVDGMDNQAPGLNFFRKYHCRPDIIRCRQHRTPSGASSALYGSGGMNGTLLINSKNPFKYQGFSFNIKQG